ncbi:PREDICTED: advanced glycosylation end product-specific receptor isoform X7 [Ceratotherium simum simum]|uniref:Advanced glycosylation end product-specific receptor isoform X7 n=1 Tax=Ceratotherium simum simum TaxID=73337 RepID=A0ABM1CFT7_CERSS|nr:PREDICTED: advanced glycosylation end product-specific receptor isoform X7 [Ceratotherium simum simum]
MAAGAAAGAWVLVLSLWGAVVGSQNITAQIGKPLVLNCKGAPKKPPQQLEWRLNTGRTEAWKVLSPQGSPWDSVARVLPNGSLLLPAIGIQDEGTFRCRATSRNGKETKSNYQVRVYQIPRKPEILDPASELMAGVPNKVGTCVSKGSYPAGTLSWHLDGKPLIPDGKGLSVKEETRRHPETGLFTLQSELMVTPARGGDPRPTFSCSFSPGLPRRRVLHTAPFQLSVWEPVPLEEVQLVVEPEGGAVAPGSTVTLTCEAPAQPPPQIHWIKDGTPLPLSPGPGDPGRPGDGRLAHRRHHVAKATTPKRGAEGPRKPGGGGGACRAESVRGARGSREQCRRALKGPQLDPICQFPFVFPTLRSDPRPILPCTTSIPPHQTVFHSQSLPQ